MKKAQQLKAQARLSAKSAPKPDPAIGKAARAEAEAALERGKPQVEQVSPTQTKASGEIAHRGSGVPMSEFTDPAANTVRAAKQLGLKD